VLARPGRADRRARKRRFVNGASDEEWLTLIGQMSRAENPGQIFLRHALSNAWLLSQKA
jgi:hypothetical protein